ncbi:TetR/AcrR family transcriptional regulator [Dokdonella sp. MW10]|uniref:TetR/AcrR family transcriptional regulator n=1 Tax=Dokdonella sp. MW10 TaxID=2992926 RepID=UPI003F7DE9D7
MASSVPPSDLTGKARIRLAAMSLFGRKGFDQTSLRLVAQRANVSIALIGHHFGDKTSLFGAVCDCAAEELVGAAADGLPRGIPLAQASAQLFASLHEAVASMDVIGPFVRRALTDAVANSKRSHILNALDASLARLFESRIVAEGGAADSVDAGWWARQTRTFFVGSVVTGDAPTQMPSFHPTRLTALFYSWYRTDAQLTARAAVADST